jgi:hypothetical protein
VNYKENLMVIKMTFRDSDLVHYLAEFCERLTWRMFDEYDIEFPELKPGDQVENERLLDEHREARKAMREKKARLLDPEHHFKKGSEEHKEIIAEVLRLWEIYDKEHNVRHTPDVSIQYGVKEHWENSEVLYHFSATDQSICM